MTEPLAPPALPVPDSALALIEAFSAFLTRLEITHRRASDAPLLAASLDGHELLAEATPGLLHLFLRLIEAPSDDEQAEAIALLTTALPIPGEYLAIAEYGTDAEQVGLRLEMPMPRSFNPPLAADALLLLAQTTEALSRLVAG